MRMGARGKETGGGIKNKPKPSLPEKATPRMGMSSCEPTHTSLKSLPRRPGGGAWVYHSSGAQSMTIGKAMPMRCDIVIAVKL